jgi:hypothetical protein
MSYSYSKPIKPETADMGRAAGQSPWHSARAGGI